MDIYLIYISFISAAVSRGNRAFQMLHHPFVNFPWKYTHEAIIL